MYKASSDKKITIPCEDAVVWEERDVKVFFPARPSDAHKGTFGKACILTYGARVGAAMLSADACLRSGAGYTTLRVLEELRPYVATALPACIVEGFTALDAEILSQDALAFGMGSGVSEELYDVIKKLLNNYRGILVLDADALNALSKYGLKPLKKKSCKVILTPHLKEFSRLCGKTVKEVIDGGEALAKAFAKEYGVTLVLKSHHTIVTDGEHTVINTTGSPALAKAGSGDVLSGLMVGTCARGLSPFDAACVSCFVFGRAGELAEQEFGQYSPTSCDVISLLPLVIKNLEC